MLGMRKNLTDHTSTNHNAPLHIALGLRRKDPVRWGLPWKIAIAFFAVYVCWGMTYLAMRVAVVDIPPHLMSGSRFVVAGLVLYAWTRARGEPAPAPKHWGSATVIGAFLLLGGNASVAWAEQRVPSGLA